MNYDKVKRVFSLVLVELNRNNNNNNSNSIVLVLYGIGISCFFLSHIESLNSCYLFFVFNKSLFENLCLRL